MKTLAILSTILLMTACQKNSDVSDTYHLIRYSGTIAGVTKNFTKGECLWEVGDNEITIDIKVSDPFVRDLTSAYTKATIQNQESWSIDSLGDFTITKRADTLWLNAPCCDFIDYMLVKD